MLLDQIHSADQHNAPSTSGLDHEFVARLEPGLAKDLGGQGCLVLATDARVTSSPLLYLVHVE